MRRIVSAVAMAAAIFAWPGHAMGQSAAQLTPVYVDRDGGHIYFLVRNRGVDTIHNLFGWVYGYGARERPGAYLVNNPHAQGLKVSLGDHVPGSVAMYRFTATASLWLYFPAYTLLVSDSSLFHPPGGAR